MSDLEYIVGIPLDEDGSGGSVEGVHVNALATTPYAKLIPVIEEKGVGAADLDFDPATSSIVCPA